MERNLILCDLDGTLYQDGVPFDGIVESLNKLAQNGNDIYYMTNNSSLSINEYTQKLSEIGFPCKKDRIISPILTAKSYFKSSAYDHKNIYVSGSVSVKDEFFDGLQVNSDKGKPDCILMTFNKGLSYAELQKICEWINDGIPYFLTHIDLSCPTAKGPIPDCGSIGELIFKTTNIRPLDHFGKPGDHYSTHISKFIKNSNAYVVGDRIYTDGDVGVKIGAKTIIVLTGETKEPSSVEGITFYDTAVDFFDTL